jgi:hypothetical protein
MPIKSELFSACLLLVTSITFIFVSLFPYFLIVGSAGQAVTLSPDLLRCAAKPVILHWLYHSSTVRGLGSGGCHKNGGCPPVSWGFYWIIYAGHGSLTGVKTKWKNW